jgi:hypothetical protein
LKDVQQLFDAIESDRFAAAVNVANNLKTFLRALAQEQEVRELAELMESQEGRRAVSERAVTLASTPVAQGYEHPVDAALAAYVWLLSVCHDELLKAAVAAVGQAQQCWWSRKIAERAMSAALPPVQPMDLAP